MQKQLFSSMLAICLLLSIGCKKTDLDSSVEGSGDNGSLVRPSVAVIQDCDVIDFEGIRPGTLLSQVTSDDGVVIPMESENTQSPSYEDAAIVFNSAAPHEEDRDLGTPSDNFGGPGEADDGGAGQPSNNTALGNIVVIQNFEDYPNYAEEQNDVDDLDDEPETIEFDFSNVGTTGTITATSITVIDVEVSEEGEQGDVILYNASGGEITRFALEETFENGVDILSLGNTPGVRRIVIEFNGSIGFDNLAFCPTITPPPPTGCTYTQGYWKTHGPGDCAKGNNTNAWPAPIRTSGITIGNVTYSPSQLCALFNAPVKGSNLGLAHQLFAAMLNSAKNGGVPPSVQTCINSALTFLAQNGGPTGTVSSSSLKSQRESLTNCLASYNEGPNHCN